MAISNRKLGYGKGGANLISLYDEIKDVGGTGFPVKIDGKILYAKIGDVKHQQASAIKVGKGGTKCLLFKARTIWNFDNVNIRYKEGSASASGSTAVLVGKYTGPSSDKYTDAELQFDVSIPSNAKNIVVKWDWEIQNKPLVKLDWFNHTLKLDRDSEATMGHYEFSVPSGSNWDNRVTVGSYDAGIFNKYLYIRNFSIEFDTD